jgi:formylglycine-generating enzyme required for sulfatase activity
VLIATAALVSCVPRVGARVSGVDVARAPSGNAADITFDLRLTDSFRDSLNWDAAWIFVKYRAANGSWRHATLSAAATDHGVATGNAVGATVTPASDGRGVFVHRATPGRGPVEWSGVRVRWNRALDEVDSNARSSVKVFAIEMVYIPAGSFHLGDGEAGNVAGQFGSTSGRGPFNVTSEAALTLGGGDPAALGNSNNYGVAGETDDFNDSVAVLLPDAFPKGSRAFYVMKHELTQGLYAEFLNMLTPEQQATRNPALNPRAPPQPGVKRYTISTVPPFFAFVPDRAAHFLSWADGAAFADWAALRPASELEFEKAARGPKDPEPGEFSWGTTRIHRGRYVIRDENTPAELITNPASGVGNAAYHATSGSDGRACGWCIEGPLRAGAFRGSTTLREEQGASIFGVLELSGNLAERVVTVGNAAGRRFDGSHGDGMLNEEGNAAGGEVETWPGSTRTGSRSQVAGGLGTGIRGGHWASSELQLRISHREFASTADNTRSPVIGHRFARGADQ